MSITADISEMSIDIDYQLVGYVESLLDRTLEIENGAGHLPPTADYGCTLYIATRTGC